MHGEPRYAAGFSHFDYADPSAPQGGVFRNAATGTFDTLNPFIVRGRAALGLGYVSESLMQRSWDEPFSLYGLIAESITVPDDRSWVEFTLRPEARWHDGVPITPADVLFSWRTLRDHGRPNHRSYYGKVAHAEQTGERTVRFTFKASADPEAPGDREMPLIMGLMPILPEHAWKTREFDRTTLEPPLGSGPYRVARFEPGRSIVYERVPDYWGRDLAVNRGQYNFAEIRYDYYRDDGVALEAFKADAYDFRRETDPTKWATGYDFPAAHDGRVKVELLPHGRPEPMRALIFNTRRPQFADRAVREALGYALDFEWMNRTLFHGAYRRTASYYPNSELAASGPPSPAELAVLEPLRGNLPPEVFGPAYVPPATDGSGPTGLRGNLRKAQELLASAGWTVRDGLLRNAQGAALEFEILLVSSADEKVALEFARALQQIGVTAKVRTVDSAQYQARLEVLRLRHDAEPLDLDPVARQRTDLLLGERGRRLARQPQLCRHPQPRRRCPGGESGGGSGQGRSGHPRPGARPGADLGALCHPALSPDGRPCRLLVQAEAPGGDAGLRHGDRRVVDG